MLRLWIGDAKFSQGSPWQSLKQAVVGPNSYFFVISVIMASLLTWLQILRYVRGHATGYDLGSTAQSLYLISQGHWLAFNTVLGTPTILDIDSFTLYLLAWPFRYMGGIYFLFVAQALAVFVFARAAYEYLFSRTGSRWWAWSFGVLALISPPVIGGLMFDFHADFIVLLGLSLSLIALLHKNHALFIAGIVLALLSKNEAALPIMAWAFVECITPSVFTRVLWFWTGLSAFLLFLLDELVLPKMLGDFAPSHLALFKAYGHSAHSIAINLIEHPAIVAHVLLGHAQYLADLSGIWGFLPLVGGLYLIPFVALIILNDLAINPTLRSLATQYSVIIDFFGLLAAGSAVSRYKRFNWHQIMPLGVGVLTTIFLLHGLWTTEIAPEITPNPVAAKEFQLAQGINRHHHEAIWTTNHLTPLVYSHTVVSDSAYQTVATLWFLRRHYAPHSRIVMFVPKYDSNPAISTPVWNALQAHYRVVASNGSDVVLEGVRPFPSYPVPAYINRRTFPQAFPAILTVPDSTAVLSSGWLISHGTTSYRGLSVTLTPGRYKIQVWLQNKHASKQGWAQIRLLSSVKPQQVMEQHTVKGRALIHTLTLQTKSTQSVVPEIRILTHHTVRYMGLRVVLVSSSRS